MSRNHRNFFKRQYVRLKGWLTLGNVGHHAAAHRRVRGGGGSRRRRQSHRRKRHFILEQQHTAELERSTHDSQAITTLRESVGRAEKFVTSAKLSVAVGAFDRAVHEHVAADSRDSAARYASARTSLGQLLDQYVRDTPTSSQALTRVVDCASQNRGCSGGVAPANAASSCGSIRTRSRPSMRASRNRVKMPGRFSVTWSQGNRCWTFTRGSTSCGPPVAMSAAFGSDAAGARSRTAEQAVAETLRANQNTLRRSQGSDWYQGIQNDVVALVPLRTSFLRSESQRIATLDNFAQQSRKLAALLPADLAVESQPAPQSVQPVATTPAPAPLQNPMVRSSRGSAARFWSYWSTSASRRSSALRGRFGV